MPDARTTANIAVVLLAAGASSRMGQPKQLLLFQGKSLLRHAAETALATPFRPVIVVLGANADLLRPELDGLDVSIVFNPHWQQGMGTSARVAAENVSALGPPPSALIFMLCDQPLVTPELLQTLAQTRQAGRKPIVACEYEGVPGVPALFGRSLFPALRYLDGAMGAKQIFAAHPGKIKTIPFPQGAVDVDTPEDYKRLEIE